MVFACFRFEEDKDKIPTLIKEMVFACFRFEEDKGQNPDPDQGDGVRLFQI